MTRTGWRCSEAINIYIFHQLTGADFVGWAFGGHYVDILRQQEQIQLGARLGGVDFHQSRQSTTSSHEQSNSRQIN
jgi:hypothetical protein